MKILDFKEALEGFEPIIGLEVHVELSTQTKLFSAAPNIAGPDARKTSANTFPGEMERRAADFGTATAGVAASDSVSSVAAPQIGQTINPDSSAGHASSPTPLPNTFVTPLCLGLPGSLPTVNEKAVDYAIALGIGLGCSISDELIFARKNYFYPDLPKNYQISQFSSPLAYNGTLEVEIENGEVFFVEIERAHLEEDAGKLVHKSSTGRIQDSEYSLVDLNRAGVPLVEIVTRPVFADASAPQVARAFVELIRDIVVTFGVSNGRMERGNIRCDANVSLRPRGHQNSPGETLPTRTETKNLNSLRSVEKAVRYEIQRQATLLASGKSVVQETRHWREDKGVTLPGRAKADSHEYRYFPEPDLLPIPIPSEKIGLIRASMPEHPLALRRRLKAEWKFTDLQFRDIVNSSLLQQVDETVRAGATPDGARKWWTGEIAKIASQKQKNASDLISPADVAEIENLVRDGVLNDSLARQVLMAVIDESLGVRQAIKKYGLSLATSESIEGVIEKVLLDNPDVVQKVASGKIQAAGVLVGACMRALGGKADASQLQQAILRRITQQ